MKFPTLNVLVFVGVFAIFGSRCSALPTQSADTQRMTVTYLTPDWKIIVKEIPVLGDTVEIYIPDVTILSNQASGLNTLVFKSEEGLRCYVSPRAAFPINVEGKLQNMKTLQTRLDMTGIVSVFSFVGLFASMDTAIKDVQDVSR